MAPGVKHCSGGAGPVPVDLQEALMKWVEQDVAPKSLLAVKRSEKNNTIEQSRPLCQYPQVARYKGHGSTDKADNFECADNY